MTTLLEAALSYAARGWRVFPVHGVNAGECTCGRADCSHPGKHPLTPHGVLDATAAPEKIRELWGSRPMASVGIAMGAASGLLAIDVDIRYGGNENLYELERRHEELPPTLTSVTGGGGSHLLFRYADGIRNQNGQIAPGIDVKSDRGYIIAPPSSHQSGRAYQWAPGCGPGEIEPAACPDWLLQLLRRDSGQRSGSTSAAEKIGPGNRNEYLTSLAGSLRRRALDYEEIERALQDANQTALRAASQPGRSSFNRPQHFTVQPNCAGGSSGWQL